MPSCPFQGVPPALDCPQGTRVHGQLLGLPSRSRDYRVAPRRHRERDGDHHDAGEEGHQSTTAAVMSAQLRAQRVHRPGQQLIQNSAMASGQRVATPWLLLDVADGSV